jgi:hypothetical protein
MPLQQAFLWSPFRIEYRYFLVKEIDKPTGCVRPGMRQQVALERVRVGQRIQFLEKNKMNFGYRRIKSVRPHG